METGSKTKPRPLRPCPSSAMFELAHSGTIQGIITICCTQLECTNLVPYMVHLITTMHRKGNVQQVLHCSPNRVLYSGHYLVSHKGNSVSI